jgi:hypothetical protein
MVVKIARFAWLTAAASVLFCGFISFGWPYIRGGSRWNTSWDWIWDTIAAQDISHGHLSEIYFNHQINSLPGLSLLLTPVVWVGDLLGLKTGYPLFLLAPQPNPSMWLLIGPVSFALGAVCIPCVDQLAARLEISSNRRRAIVVVIGSIIVPPTCLIGGHPEDLLCLGIGCLGLTALLNGRSNRAAWLLAGAIIIQPLAALLIPVFLAFAPSPVRIGVFWRMTLLPLVTALVFISADPGDAVTDLVLQPEIGSGQPLPWISLPARHMRIWVGYGITDVNAGTGVRLLAVAVAVLAGLLLARQPTTVNLIRAATASFVARPLLESQVWCWYLAPAAILACVLVGVQSGSSSRRWLLGVLACCLFYGVPAGAYVHFPDTFRLPSSLALGLMVLFVAFVAAVLDGSRQGDALTEGPQLDTATSAYE